MNTPVECAEHGLLWLCNLPVEKPNSVVARSPSNARPFREHNLVGDEKLNTELNHVVAMQNHINITLTLNTNIFIFIIFSIPFNIPLNAIYSTKKKNL